MKFFYALGELTSDITESLGTGVYKMTSRIFRAAQEANSYRVAFFFMMKYYGILFQCATLLFAFLVKSVFSIIGDLCTAIWSLLLGSFQLDKGLLIKGFLLPFHSLNGHLLVFFGYIVVVIQKLFFIQKSDRSFTENESDVLKDLFDDSLAMYNVRVVAGRCGLFHVNGRPFVLGNFIFMKDINMQRGLPILIHECVHVWQYQQYGARYASEALYAQWSLRNAYDWRSEKEKSDNWRYWNREAQAAFIEESWGAIRRTHEQNHISGDNCVKTFLRESAETSPQLLFMKEVLRDVRSRSHNRFV
jgi:hypothetical protein